MSREEEEFHGRLPNGEITLDAQLYIDKWRELAEPMCKILSFYSDSEVTLCSFDPTVSFHFKGRIIRFDADVLSVLAYPLRRHLDYLEQQERRNKPYTTTPTGSQIC